MKKIVELYDRLAVWLCSWRADRWLHFIVAEILCFAISALCGGLPGYDSGGAIATGAGITILICLAKEIADTYRDSGFDVIDLLFGFFGVLSGIILYAL